MFKKIFLIIIALAIFSFAGCVVENSHPASNLRDSYQVPSYSRIVDGVAEVVNFGSIVSQQNLGLWVNGTGKATATPDVAILTLGAESQRKNVKQAQSDVSEVMNKIKSVLNNYGVADKDIQTRIFYIY
jgi:uncharacterized protein YggE